MHALEYGSGDRLAVRCVASSRPGPYAHSGVWRRGQDVCVFFFFSCLEMILLTVSSRLIDANQDTEETMSLL